MSSEIGGFSVMDTKSTFKGTIISINPEYVLLGLSMKPPIHTWAMP